MPSHFWKCNGSFEDCLVSHASGWREVLLLSLTHIDGFHFASTDVAIMFNLLMSFEEHISSVFRKTVLPFKKCLVSKVSKWNLGIVSFL